MGGRPGSAPARAVRCRRLLAATLAVVLVGGCGSVEPSVAPSTAVAPSSAPGPSPSGASPVAAGRPACPGTPSPAAEGPWWSDRVFYEVFVRSFADTNGDGVGDLQGVIDHLDDLNDGDPATTTDLGVTGLWLMPIMPSPSYHGYDVTSYQKVRAQYGSLDMLRRLVDEAHRRGIAVILDLPLNHTSDKDPWFQASAAGTSHQDWYVWSDEPQTGTGWHELDGRWYYGAFASSMPDLNLRNAAVTAKLDEIGRFWLQDAGVDGYRLDAAPYLIEDGNVTVNTPETHAWWQQFKDQIDAADPEALLLGEVWMDAATSASYVPTDLDMTFDFDRSAATLQAIETGAGNVLSTALQHEADLYPPGGLATFLTNHDMARVATQLAGDPERLRLAATLLLTGPGVPFIYYGEEIGMTGAKPDPQIRAPMRWDDSSPAAGFSTVEPWEPLSDDPASVNVATESADPTSLLSWYRTLIALRDDHPALSAGQTWVVDSDTSSVVAALRQAPGETMVVLANMGLTPRPAPTLSLEAGPLCGALAAHVVPVGESNQESAQAVVAPTVIDGGGFAAWAPQIELPARSVTLIALQPAD
jgi:alpha-amylase